ncbi:DUF4192 domain-containing protein [Pseudonocardia hydrocarbonoxydans]|uniref:DUF4192 domain-containing protein n=1 Tax=Pseudonocardia hydrocarbonoxydans TaxID=76726 RepID=A0A4Y3WNY0_9PSEU|nr:DUF4192 domain-containing protein [Pseudonocardia hydrocarbonoxydans]GEC19750.1 hypothetical protein PHY01_20330 [Pseudonocardia hydrocarbonoxydans]
MTSTPATAPTLLRLGHPADLVAAVPVVLGFRPRESLVLVATGGPSGRRIGLTLRVDLPPPAHVHDVVAHAVATLCSDDPAGAAVVVVGARARGRTDVLDAAADLLDDHGITLHTALWAEHTDAGGRWGCFGECACTGVLADPAGTEFAAAAVVAGSVLRGSRAELERLVEPVDGVRIRRRERLLAADPFDAALPDDDARHLAVLDTALADAAAGRCVIDDPRALALAAALTRPTVRDAVLLRCAREAHPGLAGGETLWAALCRELPDPEAAEPAALLAACALLRGEGALANVALDRAERAWPGHRLARLLRSAASVPVRPEELRAHLLGTGR